MIGPTLINTLHGIGCRACIQTYNNLDACSLTQDQHSRSCGYWYTITEGAMPHTAFRTRYAMDRWLGERGLALGNDLPEQGTHGWTRISGSYRKCSHLSEKSFYRLCGQMIRVMDNGEYTLGIVTDDEDGIKTVHHLNCNVATRKTFDYRESQSMEDAA